MATVKQQIAIKKLSENIGNSKPSSMGKILQEAGYSASTCKTPQRVTESKGWKELLNEYFPNEKLLKKIDELLNKKEIFTFKGNLIKTGQPHSDVKQTLEMVFKLKAQFQNQDLNNESPMDLTCLTDQELDIYEYIVKKCNHIEESAI